jgi:hypothetical protein
MTVNLDLAVAAGKLCNYELEGDVLAALREGC